MGMIAKINGVEKVTTDLGQKLERIILQDIDALVIGAEVVYLFPAIQNK